MSPAARTVVSMQLSQLVQASKLCHRRAAARPLSRTSDKPSRPCPATRSAHRELFVLLTTSQRQTMSTRSSSVKRCLPNASSSVDHVPKSTRPALPPLFSAGSKVIRGIIARRRESLGTRLVSTSYRYEIDVSTCNLSVADASARHLSTVNVPTCDLSVSIHDLWAVDVSIRDLSVANVSIHDLSVADVSTRNLSTVNVPTCDLSAVDVLTHDLRVVDVSICDLSAVNVTIRDLRCIDTQSFGGLCSMSRHKLFP